MNRLAPTVSLGLLMPILAASTQVPSPAPKAGDAAVTSNWSHSFWDALDKLGVMFREIGSLGGGETTGGQIWVFSLVTGEQQRIDAPAPMGWPVFGQDNHTVFALHDGRIVRLNGRGKENLPLGSSRKWRKLVGVGPGDTVLGFLIGTPARPAVLTASGELHVLPAPTSAQERAQVSMLLQENRAYEDGIDLLVQRSVRGGRGFDISIVSGHANARTLTDCGDDYCGQPSMSPDHRYVAYVRAPAP